MKYRQTYLYMHAHMRHTSILYTCSFNTHGLLDHYGCTNLMNRSSMAKGHRFSREQQYLRVLKFLNNLSLRKLSNYWRSYGRIKMAWVSTLFFLKCFKRSSKGLEMNWNENNTVLCSEENSNWSEIVCRRHEILGSLPGLLKNSSQLQPKPIAWPAALRMIQLLRAFNGSKWLLLNGFVQCLRVLFLSTILYWVDEKLCRRISPEWVEISMRYKAVTWYLNNIRNRRQWVCTWTSKISFRRSTMNFCI